MPADGTIEVDLRLRLEKLRQDIQKATDSVRSGLSKSFQFAARGSDIQRVVTGFKAMREHSERTDQAVRRTATGLRVIQSGRMAGFVAGARIADVSGSRSSYRSGPGAFAGPQFGAGLAVAVAAAQRSVPPQLWRSASRFTAMAGATITPYGTPAFMKNPTFFRPGPDDRSRFWREMSLSIGPALNPGGLFANMLAGRQLFSAFSGTRTGRGMMSAAGLGTSALAAGGVTGGLLLALNAVGFALKGLAAVAQGARGAIAQAFSLRAQAGQSGLSAGFVFQRQALAQLLGVQGNPNQVFMFGKAVTDLQRRIADAGRTIAGNSPVLAQVAVNAKVLQLDLEALFSEVATKAAPALNLFMAGLDAMVKGLMKHAQDIARVALALGGAALGGGALNAIIKAAASDPATSQFMGAAPALRPFARQLPASTMERMGLVIGGAVGGDRMVDLTRQIAKSTADTYKLLAQRSRAPANSQNPYMGRDPTIPGP